MVLKDTDLTLDLSLNGLRGRTVDDHEDDGRSGRNGRRMGRILTAKDFTKVVSSMVMSGSEKDCRHERPFADGGRPGGDSVREVSSLPSNQVVGWPPIRSYRKNNLGNRLRVVGEEGGENDTNCDGYGDSSSTTGREERGSLRQSKSMFVKVNMDGTPIGRKVDLKNHACYETLAHALEEMFKKPITKGVEREDGSSGKGKQPSKLLDENSEFVLTYEDREGDWMLIGDVPWDMFLSTVRRLRIMRASEGNGLGTTS